MLSINKILASSILRILVPPFAGFLFYGSWAYWVNHEFGLMVGFKAALTQGGYSFLITLVLALLIEWLFHNLKPIAFHQWIVGFVACTLLYLSSWSVNAYSGTPNILMTILPGAIVSTVYTIAYILTLNNAENKGNKNV